MFGLFAIFLLLQIIHIEHLCMGLLVHMRESFFDEIFKGLQKFIFISNV